MDIQVSSNFERLLFDAYGRDAAAVARDDGIARAIAALRDAAARSVGDPRNSFAAGRAGEDEVAATIRTTLRETGHFIDPHTAVGVAVAEKETRDPALPMIVLSTAHAAKFPDAVEAACGVRPPLPDWLSDLDERREHVTVLPPDQKQIERLYLRPSRAAREGAAA